MLFKQAGGLARLGLHVLARPSRLWFRCQCPQARAVPSAPVVHSNRRQSVRWFGELSSGQSEAGAAQGELRMSHSLGGIFLRLPVSRDLWLKGSGSRFPLVLHTPQDWLLCRAKTVREKQSNTSAPGSRRPFQGYFSSKWSRPGPAS